MERRTSLPLYGDRNVTLRSDADEEKICCCCAVAKDFGRISCFKRMGRNLLKRLGLWLLEIEMGFVWGVAGLSIIVFVFAAIWYIDPALLTLVLQFRQAQCRTIDAAFLVGISNCSWTSCRLGCTREVYQCWQIQVSFEYVQGSVPYRPPWSSVSSFGQPSPSPRKQGVDELTPSLNLARLYPNVRGCGYPPELNCEDFFEKFGGSKNDSVSNPGPFACWVSTIDTSIAMTELDLIFIVFVLYAFCRLGVFAVCNPLKACPKSADDTVNVPTLTPKKLIAYKRGMVLKKAAALAAFQQVGTEDGEEMILESSVPPIVEEDEGTSSLLEGAEGESDGGGGAVAQSDGHQLQTLAEVLPVREPVTDNFDGDTTSVDRSRRYRRKPFVAFGGEADEDADDDFDTNTVINDLFGEEIEMMDKERLAARYDVLNLEDIGIDYDEDKWPPVNDSATSETRLMSPPRTKTASFNVTSLRKKSVTSNFSSWDDFDAGSSFDGSMRAKKPFRNSASAKSSALAGFSSAKGTQPRQRDSEDEF